MLRSQRGEDLVAEQAFKARSLELLKAMRLALVSASEAEKSAVMAITDQDSQTFAEEARAASRVTEDRRRELAGLLEGRGLKGQNELLAQFSKAFVELQRVDEELLGLAVKNSNLKAYSLAFGPAAEALKDLDAALSRIVAQGAGSPAAEANQALLLASRAQSAALRIQTLLPPHIQEESVEKMEALEALIGKEDQEVRQNLEDLAALFKSSGNPDVETARSSYARLAAIRLEILKLSRENTNVRSLAISLNQKRKVMTVCQAALAALEQAIQEESISGLTHPPQSPR